MFKSIFAIAFVVAVSAGPMMGGTCDAQKQQLQAIFKDDSLTKQQMKDNLKTFFDGVGGDAATKFNEMQTKMESMKTEMESKMSEATSKLSDAAKQITTQMKAIHDNMSITPAQEREQIKALFDGAPEAVKTELKSAKDQFMGPGPMGGPHGHGGPHHHATTASA
uniref:SXP/RAL-2 family protein Ani s 5-like cation-binding domain-containing protein n=2 Tax=Panagrolaimus TaxID=55784 RepID=A0A914QBM6_9BILA